MSRVTVDLVGNHLDTSRRVPRELYLWLQSVGYRIMDVGDPYEEGTLYLPNFYNMGSPRFLPYATDLKNYQVDDVALRSKIPVSPTWGINIKPGTMPPLHPVVAGELDFEQAMRTLKTYKDVAGHYLSTKDPGNIMASIYTQQFRLMAVLIRDMVNTLEAELNDNINQAIANYNGPQGRQNTQEK